MTQQTRRNQSVRIYYTGHEAGLIPDDWPRTLSAKIWAQTNKRVRKSCHFDRAWHALNELFRREDGIIDTYGISSIDLLNSVNRHLKDQGKPTVGIDTLLRAAGRKPSKPLKSATRRPRKS